MSDFTGFKELYVELKGNADGPADTYIERVDGLDPDALHMIEKAAYDALANENEKLKHRIETEVTEIIVNGVVYVQKGLNQNYSSTGDVRIVILQRGWVMIGRYEYGEKKCKIYNAMVIRSWGTTKGLGELAAEGPKESTRLDPTNGLVEFHPLTEVATIVCNEEKWKHHLK
jgi:hypothetical protein